jgi:hypothetical protein
MAGPPILCQRERLGAPAEQIAHDALGAFGHRPDMGAPARDDPCCASDRIGELAIVAERVRNLGHRAGTIAVDPAR